MNSKLVKAIPALIFWAVLSILAIAFYPYLSPSTNRALKKQQIEYEKSMNRINQSISNLEKSLDKITKKQSQEIPQATPKKVKTTPYGECPLSAQTYQDRYMKTINMSDFVCLNEALKRELR